MIELKKEKFQNLILSLKEAKINTLFATSVLERNVDGIVLVDDSTSPASFYVKHPYGMSILYGENGKDEFYQELKPYLLNFNKCRKRTEWLQVYPASLSSKMEALFGERLLKKNPEEPYSVLSAIESDKVLEYQRVNFTFQKKTYLSFKKSLSDNDVRIVLTSENYFNQLTGNVVPNNFWNNYSDFKKHGIGFTLQTQENLPASTAFSAYVIDRELEIGIETGMDYRGQGFALKVCARLIDYCLENGFNPVWSCSSGNIASRTLAGKLGFEECKRIPYYYLPF